TPRLARAERVATPHPPQRGWREGLRPEAACSLRRCASRGATGPSSSACWSRSSPAASTSGWDARRGATSAPRGVLRQGIAPYGVEDYPRQLEDLRAFLRDEPPAGHPRRGIHAMPVGPSVPELLLPGSSDESGAAGRPHRRRVLVIVRLYTGRPGPYPSVERRWPIPTLRRSWSSRSTRARAAWWARRTR